MKTVYKATVNFGPHDSEDLGLFSTAEAAKRACEREVGDDSVNWGEYGTRYINFFAATSTHVPEELRDDGVTSVGLLVQALEVKDA